MMLRPATRSGIRSLPIRFARPTIASRPSRQSRFLSDPPKKSPSGKDPAKGPNQDVLPHVSEEAAATGDITGEGGPEIEQGTPVSEVSRASLQEVMYLLSGFQILGRQPDGKDKAPQVIQEDMSPGPQKKGSDSEASMAAVDETEVETRGLKFGMPELPLPSHAHLKHRYDAVVQQVTNLLMRDGKLSVAQTVGSSVPQSFHRSSGAACSFFISDACR